MNEFEDLLQTITKVTPKQSKKIVEKPNNNTTNSPQKPILQYKSKKEILSDDLLTQFLHEKHREKTLQNLTYDKEWISVSDIVCPCPRKIYYRFCDNQFNLNHCTQFPYTYLITQVGEAIHKLIQELIADKYQNVNFEIELLDEEDRVKGYVDLWYETTDNTKVLVEIKTVNITEFTSTFKGRETHWKQAAMYWYLMRKLHNKTADYVQLVYIARELKPINKVKPIKIFTANPFKLWDRFGEKLLQNLRIIQHAIKTKEIPKVKALSEWNEILSNECPFCPYKEICHKDLEYETQKEIEEWAHKIFNFYDGVEQYG